MTRLSSKRWDKSFNNFKKLFKKLVQADFLPNPESRTNCSARKELFFSELRSLPSSNSTQLVEFKANSPRKKIYPASRYTQHGHVAANHIHCNVDTSTLCNASNTIIINVRIAVLCFVVQTCFKQYTAVSAIHLQLIQTGYNARSPKSKVNMKPV